MSTYSVYELYDYRKEGKLNLKDAIKCFNTIGKSPDEETVASKQFQWLCKKLAGETHNLQKNFSNLPFHNKSSHSWARTINTFKCFAQSDS